MPKSDEAFVSTYLSCKAVIYSWMVLDAICFITISAILIILIYKLLYRNGKEQFDNIVINWDFNDEPIESKLPRKFSTACILCLLVYIGIYGAEFLYFYFLTTENIPPALNPTKHTIHVLELWLSDNPQFGTSIAMIDLFTYILFIITKLLLFVIFIGSSQRCIVYQLIESLNNLYSHCPPPSIR